MLAIKDFHLSRSVGYFYYTIFDVISNDSYIDFRSNMKIILIIPALGRRFTFTKIHVYRARWDILMGSILIFLPYYIFQSWIWQFLVLSSSGTRTDFYPSRSAWNLVWPFTIILKSVERNHNSFHKWRKQIEHN